MENTAVRSLHILYIFALLVEKVAIFGLMQTYTNLANFIGLYFPYFTAGFCFPYVDKNLVYFANCHKSNVKRFEQEINVHQPPRSCSHGKYLRAAFPVVVTNRVVKLFTVHNFAFIANKVSACHKRQAICLYFED